MILVIAEKPSVAQTIAAVLGAKEKKDGLVACWNGSRYTSSGRILSRAGEMLPASGVT